jgi:hypothetical protein
MNRRILIVRIAGIICLLAGALLFIYSQYLPKVYYFSDAARSNISQFFFMKRAQDEAGSVLPAYRRIPGANEPSFIRAGRFLFFITDKETVINAVAREAISHTMFYTVERLSETIKAINGFSDTRVPAHTMLCIPGALPPYVKISRNTTLPQIPKTIGIYYTGYIIGKETTLSQIEKYRTAGINTVVFDAKDITGIVNYRSNIPMVVQHNLHEKAPIGNIDFLIRFLKDRNIYTIARIAVFRDHLLYKKVPECAIRTTDGKPWNADSNELWCDPTNRKVQDYAIALAEELAEKGIDEIQFDYIRFPTMGGLSRAALAHHGGKKSNEEVIEDFLRRAHKTLSAKKARLSIDLFGIVAWGKDVDVHRIGQRIERLAKSCDVISPMLYPSHFNDNFDGFKNPGDNPYYFIFEGCKKFISLSKPTIIRPWLQAFRWRVSSYNEKYILEQIRASDDAGSHGYLFWNASNNHETVYSALLSLKNASKAEEQISGNEKNQKKGNQQ